MWSQLLTFDFSLSRTSVVLLGVLAVATLDLIGRARHRNSHYAFAVLLGAILSIGLIKFARILFTTDAELSRYMLALGILLMLVLWRLLFGPWDAHIKATVLGTFLLATAAHLLWREAPDERLAYGVAILIALIPAVAWCALFLPYCRERMSRVLLMFFGGMTATIPVLFYDALVRHHVELDFFLFRIVPESFSRSSQSFVTGDVTLLSNLHATLLTVFLSFMFVGLIEEGSKLWVLRRNGEPFFQSIDDVMQLAIITAIGFAFAENVANASYFPAFIKEYLLHADHPNWAGFLGNVLGRSILTSMVHIVSTGVAGYFLGLAVFASPYLEESYARGRRHRIALYLHRLFRIQETSVFRIEMIVIGLVLATFLHAFSNFMVTLPEILPGNPHTLGDLFHSPPNSLFHYVSFLLFPSFLYVVGGFWLLTSLFIRAENMKERGHLVHIESFVVETLPQE
jgi:hypothetical protein